MCSGACALPQTRVGAPAGTRRCPPPSPCLSASLRARRPVLSAEQFLQLLRQLQGWWVARDADEALLAMHPHACLSHFLDVPIDELNALTAGIFTKGNPSARNAALGTWPVAD